LGRKKTVQSAKKENGSDSSPKKRKKKTGIERECEECRSRKQTLGTLCAQIFVFSGATTERRNKRDKQRKQQQQHKGGCARARELG